MSRAGAWIAGRSVGKSEMATTPVLEYLLRSCLEIQMRNAERGSWASELHHVSATWSGVLLRSFEHDDELLTVQLGQARPAMPRELLAPSWWTA